MRRLVWVWCAFAVAAWAQIGTTTRLVQVNVVVHGRDGAVVGDLTKDDFVVWDGKKQRTVSVFAKETDASKIPGAMPALPPNVFVNSLQRHAETPTNISVILFDGLNTPVTDLVYARRQVGKFLATLKPDDAVALYALGREVQVLHDFTSEPANLARLIERYRTAGERPEGLDGPLEQMLTNLNQVRDSELLMRVRTTTQALEAIARHIAPLPGRKNLIWVSAAFPFTFEVDRTKADAVQRAAQALNAANVAVYPVDARGLMVSGIGEASSPQVTMDEIAGMTGGRAFVNANDIAGSVRRAIEDTAVSYVLGFYPEESDIDGRYHELRVTAPGRKGVEVRSRKGYFASDKGGVKEAEVKENLGRAMWGPLQASGIEMAVHVDRGKDEMKLELLISARELTLVQREDRYVGKLQLTVVQLDGKGKVLDQVTDPIGLNLMAEKLPEYLQTGMPMVKAVKPKNGVSEVRVVAMDRASGVYGTVIVPMGQVK